MSEATDDYILGRSDSETQRLIIQDQIYRPITRRLFQAAGIGAGMSVLDLGSGGGDVALLLAELVGPKGRVLGIDMNPTILDTARARVAAAGWRNVEFRAGTLDTLALRARIRRAGRALGADVPARSGRDLRSLIPLLKPGGIVAFNEMDLAFPPRTFPPTPTADLLNRWMVPPEGVSAGPDVRIGTKLFRMFVEAGLPAPELHLEIPIGGGPDWPGYGYVAETLRSLRPTLAKMAPPGGSARPGRGRRAAARRGGGVATASTALPPSLAPGRGSADAASKQQSGEFAEHRLGVLASAPLACLEVELEVPAPAVVLGQSSLGVAPEAFYAVDVNPVVSKAGGWP